MSIDNHGSRMVKTKLHYKHRRNWSAVSANVIGLDAHGRGGPAPSTWKGHVLLEPREEMDEFDGMPDATLASRSL